MALTRQQERLNELTERLQEGVKNVFESEKYVEYLRVMSRFHNYSYRNTLLIAMQNPNATMVAGYEAWQKNFGRHVNRGEKAIQILSPAPYRKKQEMEVIDQETQRPVLNPDGSPMMEEVEVTIPAFRVASVFDVSQTSGEPLPSLFDNIEGDVREFENFMEAVKAISPVPIEYASMDDKDGYYDQVEKKIVLRDDMSQRQTVAAVIHEVTHAELHDLNMDNLKESVKELGKDKSTKEVEAESTAYVVSQHFGIETGENSFGYIAMWSRNKELPELQASLQVIRDTSAKLINGIEEKLEELHKEQEKNREFHEDDLVLKISGSNDHEYSYSIVENIGKEELFHLLDTHWQKLQEAGEHVVEVQDYLTDHGAVLIPWNDSKDNPETSNHKLLTFFDAEYNADTGVMHMSDLPPTRQAQMMIDRAEYNRSYFNEDEKRLIHDYAYKLDDMEKTALLIANMIDAMQEMDSDELDNIIEAAQTEIRRLPDPTISIYDMHLYGYLQKDMFPLNKDKALYLHSIGQEIHCLYPNDFASDPASSKEIEVHDGIYGVRNDLWDRFINYQLNVEHEKEARLLIGSEHYFAIYQIDHNGPGREHMFMGYDYLQRKGYQPVRQDYELTYTAPLGEAEDLNTLYERFNIDRPEDFKGHSMSVSDIVLINDGIGAKAYYVDSFGFQEVPEFLRSITEQEKEVLEAAFQTKNGYITVHETDGGYDYSIYDRDYKLMDGGVYDNPNLTVFQVAEDVARDFLDSDKIVRIPLENIEENIENANRIELKPEPYIDFFVAECEEFHELGNYYDGLTLEEAVEKYKEIIDDPRLASKINGMGIVYHDPNDNFFSGTECTLVLAESIHADHLEFTPILASMPIVQQTINELRSIFPHFKYYPLQEETKTYYLEKMNAHQFAEELDKLAKEFDAYDYMDRVDDEESLIEKISLSLLTGEAESYYHYLQEMTDENNGELSVRANELLGKLKEYQPVPDQNMEPVVKITFSESKDFSDKKIFNLKELDEMVSKLDRKYSNIRNPETGDAKQTFRLQFTIYYPQDGEMKKLQGKMNIGDGDGGIISSLKTQTNQQLSDQAWMAYNKSRGEDAYKTFITDLTDMQEHILPHLQSFCSIQERQPDKNVDNVTVTDNEKTEPSYSGSPQKQPSEKQRKTSQQTKNEKTSIHERLRRNKEIIATQTGSESIGKEVELA